MSLRERLQKLEQYADDRKVPAASHIAYLHDDENYEAELADIEAHRATGQHVVVFTVKDFSL